MEGTIHEIQAGDHTMVAIGYNEDKPGTPLILLHGILSSPRLWIATPTPILTERFRWYALTLPGHFPAEFPDRFYRKDLTAEMIADVTADAIRQLVGDTPVILLGHSTGGFAALAVAAQHPEMVKSVICVSGFAQGTWGGLLRPLQLLAQGGAVGEALFGLNVRISSLSRWIFEQMGAFYAADRKAYFAFPGLRATTELLYEDAQQLDLKVMAHYFSQMPKIDISEWLPKISVPTLVITGSKDPIVPPAQAELITKQVPNSELVKLAGAGHVPMSERSDEYTRTVTAWLEKYG